MASMPGSLSVRTAPSMHPPAPGGEEGGEQAVQRMPHSTSRQPSSNLCQHKKKRT